MKRLLILTLLGLGVGIVAYSGVYFLGTAEQRTLQKSESPELAWLKTEFGLSADAFDRISKLHYSYLPKCDEMCALVAEKNKTLRSLVETGAGDGDEWKRVMSEAVQIRAECQETMLEHFYKVSREMRAEPRRRYLEWVLAKTVPPSHEALNETLNHHP